MLNNKRRGLLIILSSPSGAGKSTLSRRLMKWDPSLSFSVSSTITFANAMGSMCDYILSGIFVRFPKLRIAYAEGQVGWMPYVIERMDKIWEE